jgi:CBS domain-containing protein
LGHQTFYCESLQVASESLILVVAMEVSGTVSAILAQKGSSVWSIGPNAMVFDAIQLMADKNVGALPVVDAGRLVGILSERDYTRKVILKGRSSKETPVSDIMTRDPKTASPNDAVSACMRIMTETRVRHLPVVENGKMIGLLSIGDLVKWVISAQSATIDHLEKYIIGEYS